MSLNVLHLREFVVRPVLAVLDLEGGLAAEQLVLGTAAAESAFVHLDQLERPGHPPVPGPALGLWQMEKATFYDLWGRYLTSSPRRRELGARVREFLSPTPDPWAQLAGNLYLGAAMCRICYFARPFYLPGSASVDQLAALWKGYYNTERGAGTVQEFIDAYRRHVAPVYAAGEPGGRS